MANPNPKQENLKPGENIKHGFYADGFLPCSSCPEKDCPNKNKFKDHRGTFRCIEEKNFFEEKVAEIKENFKLDAKDEFQLPQMIITMIRLKRMNRYMAKQGPTGTTFMFNPKTGDEKTMDAPNVLNRDAYYAQKALLSWLDSLKLSRSARQAKDGVDVLVKMMK